MMSICVDLERLGSLCKPLLAQLNQKIVNSIGIELYGLLKISDLEFNFNFEFTKRLQLDQNILYPVQFSL